MKRKIFSAFAFVFASVSVFSQSGYTLKIGYGISAGLCSAPFFIAEEKGFFKEEGLKYEAVKIDTLQVSQLLTTGQIDLAYNMLMSLIQPITNGLDVKVPLALHTGCLKVLVSPSSSIRKPEDLKGKKIGVPSMAGPPTVVTQRYLAKRGIGVRPPNLEVEWLVYPLSELGLALEKGLVDAIALNDPGAQIIQNSGKGRAIIDTAVDPEMKDEFCCVLIATSKVAREHPDELTKATRAIQKAARFVEENPEETARLIAEKKYVAGDPKVNAALLQGYSYRASVSEAKTAILRVTEDLRNLGLIPNSTNVTRFTNNVFLQLPGVPDSLYK
jgi:NitT/TauT family transport system substrate-binding protein